MDESTRLITALTISRDFDGLVFGSQIKKYSVIEEEDWSFGDKLEISSWLQKSFDDFTPDDVEIMVDEHGEQYISTSNKHFHGLDDPFPKWLS